MRKPIIFGALAALIGLGAVAQVNAQTNEPAKPVLQDKGVITGPSGQPAARDRYEARHDRDGAREHREGRRHHREARNEHRHDRRYGHKHEGHEKRDYAYRYHHADRDNDGRAGQDQR